MIVSASRRTDIPACRGSWLIDQVNSGRVPAENPYNRRTRIVSLAPEDVDELVLWSKDPSPLLTHMGSLSAYRCRMLMTINAYSREIEPNIPDLKKRIDTFRSYSLILGAERTVWRYDPLMISPEYTVSWHQEFFSMLCESLAGYTQVCIISFLDIYAKRKKALMRAGIRAPDKKEITAFARIASQAASRSGIRMQTCCESDDVSAFAILPGPCMPGRPKARGQRPGCLCAQSVDIGTYGSCTLGCIYCYG